MRTLIVLALVTGCGAMPKHGGSSDGAAPAQVGAEGAPTEQATPDAAAAPKVDPTHSLLVADASKEPACDAEAEGWLVYLKAEKKFQACEGGTWADVAIPVPTAMPTATPAPADPLGDAWTDPDTSVTWKIVTLSSHWTDQKCPSGFSLPQLGNPTVPSGLSGSKFASHFSDVFDANTSPSCVWTDSTTNYLNGMVTTASADDPHVYAGFLDGGTVNPLNHAYSIGDDSITLCAIYCVKTP